MLDFIQKKHRIIIILLFLLMTIVGLVVTPDYGMPWDELMEIRTLGTNLREYVELFVDEAHEPQASATGIEFTDVTENVDIDHGQSVYYPIAPVLFFNLGTEAPRTLMLIWHGYTFLIFMAGVVGLFFIASKLCENWKYGLLASLFLYLSPRFFAEGHYNSKDIMTMSMIILCFWFFIRFLETRKRGAAVLFALFGALAANMRISGMFFFGLCGLMYLIVLSIKKEWNRQNFFAGLLAIVAFAGFYFLLTPVCWPNPIRFFSYVLSRSSNFSDWPGYVYYMGTLWRPVPWHYIPVLFAITTPPLIVLLTVAGNAASIAAVIKQKPKDLFSGNGVYYMICMVYIWIFLGFAIIEQPILYDSWRHFYFLNGLLIILAVFGLRSIVVLLKNKWKWAAVGAVTLQLLACVVIIFASHPFEFVYFNNLAGSDPAASYDMDYWNVSQAKALMQLIDIEDPSEQISVTAADWYSADGLRKAHTILPVAYQSRMRVIFTSSGQIALGADYLLINLRAYQVAENKELQPPQKWLTCFGLANYMENYRNVVSLRAFGSDFMMIYQMP